jgi:U3 small nucleolar RNA-associated protein 14
MHKNLGTKPRLLEALTQRHKNQAETPGSVEKKALKHGSTAEKTRENENRQILNETA